MSAWATTGSGRGVRGVIGPGFGPDRHEFKVEPAGQAIGRGRSTKFRHLRLVFSLGALITRV